MTTPRTAMSPRIMAIRAMGLIFADELGFLGGVASFEGIELGVDDIVGVRGLLRGVNGDAMAPTDPGLLGSATKLAHF